MPRDKDLSLNIEYQSFRNNPGSYLEKNSAFIYYLIYAFLNSGKYKAEEEELFHFVVDVILTKKVGSIIKNYKNEYSFSTYFSNVVKNILKDYFKKEKRFSLFFKDILLIPISFYTKTDCNIYFSEELKRLDFIIELCSDEKTKLLYCLKAYYSIKFEKNDFERLKDQNPTLKENIDIAVNEIISTSHKAKAFENLAVILNSIESSDYKPDSLRKWTERKCEEILKLLNYDKNGNKIHFYEKDTLIILLEKYFFNLSKINF